MGDASRKQGAKFVKLTDEQEENVQLITENGDAHVLDRSNIGADSSVVQINNTPKIINVQGNGVDTENLEQRKTIIIQPLDGACFWGFNALSQPHRLNRRDLLEIKVGPNQNLYVRKNGGANQNLAVTELS